MDASRLFVETNATDGDAGLQLDLDGEDWDRVRVTDPRGWALVDFTTRGSLTGYGLTGVVFESSEPPFSEHSLAKFRARFPQGVYTFRGTTVDGERIVGTSRLTHVFPASPVITAPAEDAAVSPADFQVQWQPVTRARGVNIVEQQVIVTRVKPTSEIFIAELPAGPSRVSVPAELLQPGRRHTVEVFAREASGNRTITELPFTTAAA